MTLVGGLEYSKVNANARDSPHSPPICPPPHAVPVVSTPATVTARLCHRHRRATFDPRLIQSLRNHPQPEPPPPRRHRPSQKDNLDEAQSHTPPTKTPPTPQQQHNKARETDNASATRPPRPPSQAHQPPPHLVPNGSPPGRRDAERRDRTTPRTRQQTAAPSASPSATAHPPAGAGSRAGPARTQPSGVRRPRPPRPRRTLARAARLVDATAVLYRWIAPDRARPCDWISYCRAIAPRAEPPATLRCSASPASRSPQAEPRSAASPYRAMADRGGRDRTIGRRPGPIGDEG